MKRKIAIGIGSQTKVTPVAKTEFFDPGELIHRDLRLALVETAEPVPDISLFYPRYIFRMTSKDGSLEIGDFEFRLGNDEFLVKYAGHIFYSVNKRYRGRRYAVRSCKLIYPLAKKHGMDELWVTCNPDNIASRRTCEILGGKMEGISRTPASSYYAQVGEKKKCRYRVKI